MGNLGPIEWSQITKTTGGFMFQSAEELLAFVKEEGVETIDCRFCDLPGVMQHFLDRGIPEDP